MDLFGYFDYAAATPLDAAVDEAMRPFLGDRFFNPSAQYEPAREVKKTLDQARSTVAQIIGSKPAEIIFTAGGSEANNLAIKGVMQRYPEANMICSAIEHESVRAAARKYAVKECPVLTSGLISLDALETMIDDCTVLISVILANNEIGTIQPIRKMSQMISEIRANRKKEKNDLPLYLHTDAAQAPNYLDLHVHRMGVDLMSLNGGKIYGPKQTGVLYVHGGVILEPLVDGGGQERGLRSGTENVAGIVGFAKALELAAVNHKNATADMQVLQGYFYEQLAKKIPDAVVNGTKKQRLPNNVHITIEDQDNERLLMLLDDRGFYAAAGSACSASHEEPSHVLTAIGLSTDQIRASLRFSMGKYTTREAVDKMIDSLAAVLA